MVGFFQTKLKMSSSLKSMFALSSPGLSKKQKVMIDFERFSALMSLHSLNLDEKDLTEIKDLFDLVKNTDEDAFSEGHVLWDEMISLIDEKVTESNFRRFKVKTRLDSYPLREEVKKNIRRLYFLTDSYSLNGRLSEAREAWKLLMMLMQREIPNFKPVSLNNFDGAIPDFS